MIEPFSMVVTLGLALGIGFILGFIWRDARTGKMPKCFGSGEVLNGRSRAENGCRYCPVQEQCEDISRVRIP